MAFEYTATRLCLLSNNSVLGCFQRLYSSEAESNPPNFSSLQPNPTMAADDHHPHGDSRQIVLHLSPSGGCYTLLDWNGRLTKHLTRFFPSNLRYPLLRLVKFRNAHVEGDPYICEELLSCSEYVTVANRLRVFRFRFNSDVDDNSSIEQNGDCKSCERPGRTPRSSLRWVESIDGNARIRLTNDQRYAEVKYLTPLACSLKDTRYAWMKRWIHVETQTPRCQFYPVVQRLLALASESQSESESDAFTPAMQYIVAQIPRCPPCAHEPNWEVSEDLFALAAKPMYGVLNSAGIRLEWTQTAVYRVVTNKGRVNVLASISNDQSTLEFADITNGTLLHKTGKQERLYVKEGIPQNIRRGLKQGEEYNLEAIAQKCYILLKESEKVDDTYPKMTGSEAEREGDDALNIYLVKVEKVRNLGQFTALSDRSIKAVFDDRTVLHSNAGFTQCQVVFKDGSAINVNVSLPLHAEQYVHTAQAFYQWVFKRKEAVAKKARRSHVQALVDQTNLLATSHQRQVGIMLASSTFMR